MAKRLRLLKVIVQPVFVLDDGEELTELTTDPVIVAARDWPDYPKTTFLESVADLRAQFDAQEG